MRRGVVMLVAILVTALFPGRPTAEPSLEITARSVDRAVPMFVNLAALVDWNTQQPFLDRMKTARGWIGHLPNQWGGLGYEDLAARGILDAYGWPMEIPRDLSSIGTLIMTDLPERAMSLSGRYVLEFEGSGIVEVTGRARNVRYGKNQVSFDFTPGSSGVDIRIQRSDPGRTGDYVRNITVVREDERALFQSGEIFNPEFLEILAGFQGLRFMEWMQTNNSEMSTWEERALPTDYTYTRRGIPFELIARLVNETGTDPWVTLPHKATDRFFENAAILLRDAVNADQRVYVEYSNEVWNWGFFQAHWADEQAMARWNVEHQWQQFYGMRAAQMALIWQEVFADVPDRLYTVLSTQMAWLGLEDQVLHAGLWQNENPSNPAPYSVFDGYAITGYADGALGLPDNAAMLHGWIAESEAQAEFDGKEMGLSGAALEDYVAEHGLSLASARAGAQMMDGRVAGFEDRSVQYLLDHVFPYHHDVATRHGLQLIMYEGGTHVLGQGANHDDPVLERFYRHFNYSEEMAVLYSHLLSGWAGITDGPFNIFNDIAPASKWGSFGAIRFYGDENPRWKMIRAFLDGPEG